MTESEFFKFLERILENGSNEKSRLSLEQFKRILKLQGADDKYIRDIDVIINAIPEAKELVKSSKSINSNGLEIIQERAEIRKHREKMASWYGRCG